ncbi:3-hydroxyanthranilate 3,4-dioxygenase-like [Watersipora subatra]|uniref:3-hydroxyanthranilate 3,4-dioxygenase-like n=1 Tax=Watersipora subatra TaxID=2589382 RepID=UPI00355BB05A
MDGPKLHNIDRWVEENQQFFKPPVCNKMMHEQQMKCFFVGGPNVRKDYHIEEGPEFFYMLAGDMCLKVMEQNKPKDVVIKQGEVFMLPPRIPHSPQRKAGTVGLVIERERQEMETDGLRYFVEKNGKVTSEILYEKWFHCENLGPQLASAINEYFQTEQSETGVPIAGTIKAYDEAPVKIDLDTAVMTPFSLNQWLEEHKEAIESQGSLDLFRHLPRGTEVKIYGPGTFCAVFHNSEVIFWVLSGGCTVSIDEREQKLGEKDTLWLPVNMRFTLNVSSESRVFMLSMAPPSASS